MEHLVFAMPHGKRTSGGVYAMVNYAQELSTRCSVSIVAQKPPLPEVHGIQCALSAEFESDAFPDADAIIVNADTLILPALCSLPASKGKVILYFQGYGALKNPAVVANLSTGLPVITSAHWLKDEAERFGRRAWHLPYGLAQEMFYEDPVSPRSPCQIAMLTHSLDWKGTDDGIAALNSVRARVPEVEIWCFGTHNPGHQGNFLYAPSRAVIADLLRSSTCFVCPSWEEGFGLPGLEALACGASLATTDTKGSRDYALHERTALVSPPKEPKALAENIIRLLSSEALRLELQRNARKHVQATYHSWSHSAELFLSTIHEILSSTATCDT